MKIIDVEAIWLRVPALDQPCEWGEDALIVRIHTDTGLIGVGETDSSPAVVKALIETPASHETCQGLRDILLGENPLEIDRLWKKMYRQSEYMGPPRGGDSCDQCAGHRTLGPCRAALRRAGAHVAGRKIP